MKTIKVFGFRTMNPPVLPALDCRVIRNPWFRGITDSVAFAKVSTDPKYGQLVDFGVSLLGTHEVISVGCAFGKHRSMAVALGIQKRLKGVQLVRCDGSDEVPVEQLELDL